MKEDVLATPRLASATPEIDRALFVKLRGATNNRTGVFALALKARRVKSDR
jgi:5-formaminoimidazole-4-carboxamide-1-beta-D-ribofuranosyl 5'-monophosphate synthetase